MPYLVFWTRMTMPTNGYDGFCSFHDNGNEFSHNNLHNKQFSLHSHLKFPFKFKGRAKDYYY